MPALLLYLISYSLAVVASPFRRLAIAHYLLGVCVECSVFHWFSCIRAIRRKKGSTRPLSTERRDRWTPRYISFDSPSVIVQQSTSNNITAATPSFRKRPTPWGTSIVNMALLSLHRVHATGILV